jgi:hypothetical protein
MFESLGLLYFSTALGRASKHVYNVLPPITRMYPVDRDHEIIKRIRTLVKNAQKNCVGLPHPCDVCK